MNRPNVIYILTDDQRADMLGCAGHPVLKTPHLDRLAEEGTRFRNAFCTSPLCTPSRVSHYTGMWERRHGINFNSQTHLTPEAWEQSFPMQLKKEGYFVGWVGKNHVPAGPSGDGYNSGYFEEVFDYWYGNHGHSGFYPKEQAQWGGERFPRGTHDTQPELFAEGALNFISPQDDFLEPSPSLPRRPTDQPFCLCVTFNLPHDWGTGPMELRSTDDEIYQSAYRDQFHDLPIPETYVPYSQLEQPRLPVEVYNGLQITCYDYVRSELALRERLVRQCQTISGIDRFIGQLRDELERQDLAENTIIVFSTDHGIHFGEHGLGGKALLYEEDLRIPLIIYDPRQAQNKGQRRDETVLVPDLAPTVLELCGYEPSEVAQGRSLVPLLKGEQVDWRDEFFAENMMDIQNYPRCECLRNADWKYIRYFARAEDPEQKNLPYKGTLDNYQEKLSSTLKGEPPIYEELYCLQEDPQEQENRIDDPASQGILQSMRERLFVHLEAAHGGEHNVPIAMPSS